MSYDEARLDSLPVGQHFIMSGHQGRVIEHTAHGVKIMRREKSGKQKRAWRWIEDEWSGATQVRVG